MKEGPFENTKKNTENDIIEEITGDFLIKQIYNKTENNFRYELLLKTNFPKIIYKERYFK